MPDRQRRLPRSLVLSLAALAAGGAALVLPFRGMPRLLADARGDRQPLSVLDLAGSGLGVERLQPACFGPGPCGILHTLPAAGVILTTALLLAWTWDLAGPRRGRRLLGIGAKVSLAIAIVVVVTHTEAFEIFIPGGPGDAGFHHPVVAGTCLVLAWLLLGLVSIARWARPPAPAGQHVMAP